VPYADRLSSDGAHDLARRPRPSASRSRAHVARILYRCLERQRTHDQHDASQGVLPAPQRRAGDAAPYLDRALDEACRVPHRRHDHRRPRLADRTSRAEPELGARPRPAHAHDAVRIRHRDSGPRRARAASLAGHQSVAARVRGALWSAVRGDARRSRDAVSRVSIGDGTTGEATARAVRGLLYLLDAVRLPTQARHHPVRRSPTRCTRRRRCAPEPRVIAGFRSAAMSGVRASHLSVGAAALLVTATCVTTAEAQARRGAVRSPTVPVDDVRTLQVRPNIYMVTGSGANVTVQVGKHGVLLVDAPS